MKEEWAAEAAVRKRRRVGGGGQGAHVVVGLVLSRGTALGRLTVPRAHQRRGASGRAAHDAAGAGLLGMDPSRVAHLGFGLGASGGGVRTGDE